MTPNDDNVRDTGQSPSRLRALFAAAVELEEPARAAWIAANVVDAGERARLDALLCADTTDGGYLATPATEHLAQLDADAEIEPGALVGQRVGAFRLMRSLGRGGMAEVFLGERDGGDFTQRVAVKLLRRGLYSDVEQRLFRRERQLLAALEHPNIARLIDGGVTAAGIPYLALEFVDGEPVTRYAAQRRLPVRARVELFLVVCRAVEAAHRALIVHRDIKPSNIIVSADGTVKLLDFGIAKLLEDDVEAPTVGVFTPDYAAPEQLTGAVVTTATDVYALGVLLHELLLGERPQGEPTRRPSSLARAGVARNPAAVPNPATLPRELRGDLDTIILKCLEPEPGRRYASAGALADDVQRYLAGRAVEAHPPSRRYRIGKFVQRHSGATLVTSIMLLGMLGALGVTLWQSDVARREAARAREVQDFVESLFRPLQEALARERTPSVRELLQRGLARVETSFAADRRAQAELLAMFARINDSIGEVKGNRDLSERAWRLSAEVFGPQDVRTLRARELHARVLGDLGDDSDALAELTEVRKTMQAAGVHGLTYASLLDDLSALRMDQGADDDEIIALRQEELAERQADPAVTLESLASGYNNLGVAYDRASRWQPAMQWYRKAYATDMQAKGDSFASAVDLGNVGNIEYWTGHWRESVATLADARAMYRRAGIDNHPNLVSLLVRLCDEQAQLELNSEAAATCEEAVAMAAKVFGDASPSHAMALIRRSGASAAAGRYAVARADLDRARAIYAAAQGDQRRALQIADVTQATLDYRLGDDAALRDHLQAYIHAAASARSPSAPRIFAWFALACRHAPAPPCASDQARQAERVLADPDFARHPNQLPGRVALARIDLERGEATAAIARIEAGLSIAAAQLGERHSWVGEAHLVLGDARRALGDLGAARREFTAAASALAGLPEQDALRERAAGALRDAAR